MKTDLVHVRNEHYACINFKRNEIPTLTKCLKIIFDLGWLLDEEISDEIFDYDMDPFYAKILNIDEDRSLYFILHNEERYEQFLHDWNRANDVARGKKNSTKKNKRSGYTDFVEAENKRIAEIICGLLQTTLSPRARTVMVTFKGTSGPETMRTCISYLKNLELTEKGHVLGYMDNQMKALPFMPRDIIKITYYRRVVYEKSMVGQDRK